MEWIKVDSSSISQVRYNENTMVLEIEFQGGRVYRYFDVPLQVFEGLRNADSHGKYLTQHIKGHYRYTRV